MATGLVVLPFRVSLEAMEGLVVASFRDDPEFEALEPQVFDDSVNGRGLRVLRYRKNGKVDVYWEPGVRVDPGFTVGAGVGDFGETAMEPARLEIDERGLDVQVGFTDAQGRRVELSVREEAGGRRGFPLLAPVGADIVEPTRLFLVYMPAIDLVRRSGPEVAARIGDRVLKLASLPVLLGGRRVWFIRYAAKPVIGVLNPPADRPVVTELRAPGAREVEGMTVVADGDGAVTRLCAGPVELSFEPGFRSLTELGESATAGGRWSIGLAGERITGGSWSACRTGARVEVGLDVTDRWKPRDLPLSMKVLVRVVPKFRVWPTTYRWRGVIELAGTPAMSGRWERVEPK